MTRRDVFRTVGVACSPTLVHSSPVPDAIPGAARIDRDYWNDWPAWFTSRIEEARAARMRALSAITTEVQARARAEFVRTNAWDLVGGQLARTSLNAQTTGTVDRGKYRIEKVIFESQPQFFVTANLYIPANARRNPAILCPLGHSSNGKAYRSYQHLFQNLARLGFVVLAFDPIGQGERQYYLDARTGKSRFGPTGEHDQAGRPALLVGSSMAQYRVWDGIRALDYLVSRSEVDPERIGCTGHSGGGTLTMWLTALEPRIRVAVEMEGHSENFASLQYAPPGPYADAEQNVIGGLRIGIDRGDLLSAFAPKPLLVGYTPLDVGTTYSATYEVGTLEIMKELRRVYGLFGTPEKVDVVASTLPHDYDFLLRRAAYNWFTRWLGNGGTAAEEAPFDEAAESVLNCTATGQVMTSIGGRSVVQVNADRMRRARVDGSATPERVRTGLKDSLFFPSERTDLRPRTISRSAVPGFTVEEIVFESEPALRIPGWFVKPQGATGRLPTVLLVGDAGKDELLESATQAADEPSGHAVCVIDLRGMGISTPRFPAAGPQFFGGDGFEIPYAWAALTLGRPVLGQRVWDYLRAVDYLVTRPDVDATQLHAAGIGSAALSALFATVLDERLRSVVLDRTIADLRGVVQSDDYNLRTQWFVPGLLRHLDIPDAVAALGARRCQLVNPTDASGEALNESAVHLRYPGASNVSILIGPEYTWKAGLRRPRPAAG